MALLTPEDFEGQLGNTSYEAIENIIEDAVAIAEIYAPCISNPQFNNLAAAKAIIRKAILYDYDAALASRQTEQTGPYSVTNFAPTRSGTFYSPAQQAALASLCKPIPTPNAYSVPLDFPDTLSRD